MKCICGKCNFILTSYNKSDVVYSSNIVKKKAGVIIYNKKLNKILIIQSRGNLWGFPKGSFNKGETFNMCALRELKEETGIILSENVLEGCESYNVNESVRYYLLLTNTDYKDVTLQHDKYCEDNDVNGICWISIDCLKNLFYSNKIKLNYHARSCLYKFFKISKKL